MKVQDFCSVLCLIYLWIRYTVNNISDVHRIKICCMRKWIKLINLPTHHLPTLKLINVKIPIFQQNLQSTSTKMFPAYFDPHYIMWHIPFECNENVWLFREFLRNTMTVVFFFKICSENLELSFVILNSFVSKSQLYLN